MTEPVLDDIVICGRCPLGRADLPTPNEIRNVIISYEDSSEAAEAVYQLITYRLTSVSLLRQDLNPDLRQGA